MTRGIPKIKFILKKTDFNVIIGKTNNLLELQIFLLDVNFFRNNII